MKKPEVILKLTHSSKLDYHELSIIKINHIFSFFLDNKYINIIHQTISWTIPNELNNKRLKNAVNVPFT